MKRLLFFTALAATMLASCQKSFDDKAFVRSADDSEVRLKLNVKSATKSFVESTNTVLEENGFRVAAVRADKSVMFNEEVTFNPSDGTFSVPGKHYYFPSKSEMAFYAVYPGSQAIAVDAEGKATIAYSQNGSTDLVGAKAENVKSTPDPVLMRFGHLLSQVSVNVQGIDPDYNYELNGISISDAATGTYAFADSTWTPGTETQLNSLFNGNKGIGIEQLEPVGDTLSFIPGNVKLKANWIAYTTDKTNPDFTNDVTVEVPLEQGKHTILNLFLPADPDSPLNGIRFEIEVGEWVKVSGDSIYMYYTPELITSVFTVNDSGKKVRFTKGNLYWDGSKFHCEKNQYDRLPEGARDSSHVGHFFWSKDARAARSKSLNDAERDLGITTSREDTFFAANGGVFENLTVLDKDEWQYLYDHALAKNSGGNYNITVDGNKCLVFKPDGFSGTVKDNYTKEEWIAAEASGLVAVPFAGECEFGTIQDLDYSSAVWTSSKEDTDNYDVYAAKYNITKALLAECRLQTDGSVSTESLLSVNGCFWAGMEPFMIPVLTDTDVECALTVGAGAMLGQGKITLRGIKGIRNIASTDCFVTNLSAGKNPVTGMIDETSITEIFPLRVQKDSVWSAFFFFGRTELQKKKGQMLYVVITDKSGGRHHFSFDLKDVEPEGDMAYTIWLDAVIPGDGEQIYHLDVDEWEDQTKDIPMKN